MGKSKIHVDLNFISIDGVSMKPSDKITIWVGYAQKRSGWSWSRASNKRNDMDMHWCFTEKAEKKQIIYIYAYNKRKLRLKNQIAGCSLDLAKIDNKASSIHVISMDPTDPNHSITVSLTVRKSADSGNDKKNVAFIRVNSENKLLNSYECNDCNDSTITSYLC